MSHCELPQGLAAPRGLAWAWSTLACAYGQGVALRTWAYARGWFRIQPPPCWTLSVGGLEVGGSGKTPVTAWLLAHLLAAGHRPGLLTRGYGRRSRGLRLRRPGTAALAADLGDEPAMLVAGGLDVAIVACGDRRRGARILRDLGCDVLVLDDGFGHRALGRHLDLVVLRSEAPLGTGHLLPRGSLREPASALGRADVLLFLCKDGAPVLAPAPGAAAVEMRALAPQALWVAATAVAQPPCSWRTGAPLPLAGRRVLGATGIAQPSSFRRSLVALGVQLVGLRVYPDHHPFATRDLAPLRQAMVDAGAELLVVTAKDAVKLGPIWPDELGVVGLQLQLLAPAAFLARLAASRPTAGGAALLP